LDFEDKPVVLYPLYDFMVVLECTIPKVWVYTGYFSGRVLLIKRSYLQTT